MNSPTTISLGPLRLSPSAAGAFYSFVSVIGYGTANACMRKLSDSCVLTWAICNKELITVAVVGPWLAWQVFRGKMKFPTGRPLAILFAAGLSTELIGNIGIQWGYQAVGLAVMIPANTGFVLVSTALLGGLLLGEHVSLRNTAVIALLIVALALLGYGSSQAAAERQAEQQAEKQQQPAAQASLEKPPPGPALVAVAIGVACVTGTVFTLLAISLRHCVNAGTSLSAAVVMITGMGVLTLAPLSFYSAGPEKVLSTLPEQYAFMYAAGACNLLAFLALVRGLQLTTVMHVNMITNAGQVALAAAAGVLLFHELCNLWLVLGVALMIVSIFAFGRPVAQEAVDAHV